MVILPDFALYLETVATPLFWLLIFAGLDLLFGVGLALIQKRFEWERLTDYLISNGVPIVAWLVVEFILLAPQSVIPESIQPLLDGLGWLVYATVAGKILASLLGHFASLGLLTNALDKIGIKPNGGGE